MAQPQVRLGDVNSYPAPVIGVKAARVLVNGLPASTAGDFVAPHDEDPVHFAVTTSSNPRVVIQGTPVTRIGDIDTFGHSRITGSANVLT